MTQDENGRFWNEPHGIYWQAAVDELGADAPRSELYERAWELQGEDERDEAEDGDLEPFDVLGEVRAVIAEATRLARDGGTVEERAAHEERKGRLVAELERIERDEQRATEARMAAQAAFRAGLTAEALEDALAIMYGGADKVPPRARC